MSTPNGESLAGAASEDERIHTQKYWREQVAQANRVVVKIGSSSLTTNGQLDISRLERHAQALVQHRLAGKEVVLVSSGAIASALATLDLPSRPRDLATQQAAASVGQGLLLAEYARVFGAAGLTVGQVLLTIDDVVRRSHYRNAQQTFLRLLEFGVVPIVNENDTVATQEIRFGDNDRLAALVAQLIRAEALVLLSDVDGLYTAPPKVAGSRRIEEVASEADLAGMSIGGAGEAKVGSGGMITKVEAAAIANAAGIPVLLTHADELAAALAGEHTGTVFFPTGKRRPRRLQWLAHAASVRGQLRLDQGAVDAVLQRHSSLLPVGIASVQGDFEAGDPVELLGPDGSVIGRGLTNYSSTELPRMLGKNTHHLREELGRAYEREVVHRDDLVLSRKGAKMSTDV